MLKHNLDCIQGMSQYKICNQAFFIIINKIMENKYQIVQGN